MKENKFRIYALVILFLAAISFPLINSRLHLLHDIQSFENRAMAKKPVFDIEHLDPFPARYDTFYTDHFDLRNRYIRYFNIYNVLTYRKSPLPSVVIGKDNWLYIMGEEMDSYMGKNRFSEKELGDFNAELTYRKNYFEQRGIKFYFLVVPCKASIHTENIGYEYFRMHKDSWGEQLNSYLNKNTSVKPIEVFDSLRKYKGTQNLFYKLDNHWNDLGAFYTANEVLKRMHTDFTEIEPLNLSDYTLNYSEKPAGNLEKMLGNLGVFSESYVALKPKKNLLAHDADKANYPSTPGFAYPWEYEKVREISPSKKPKLLIISDSFGRSIFPFLSENFSKTVKIFDSWQYQIHEEIVAQEKPDAVLLMINEPILRSFLKSSPRIKH
ncbi:hypothetical protein CNR22_19280 [Sphingobacteriaceae bacterium]|nr:hypothetical protein CNR22_19280 [Sphingobacteriaceae bacterium]